MLATLVRSDVFGLSGCLPNGSVQSALTSGGGSPSGWS